MANVISDNILLVQEFIHDSCCAPIRHSLMAIKLDMEQAYDQMSQFFQYQMLHDFGFQERWIDWIIDCVEAPSFSIFINGGPTEFFHSIGGLCQGCPLSPYLFILNADALSHTLWVTVQGLVLEPYWLTLGAIPLLHLLFTEDCLLIGRASIQNTGCSASIIEAYYLVTGQLVNSQKSSIIFSPKMKFQVKQVVIRGWGSRSRSDP